MSRYGERTLVGTSRKVAGLGKAPSAGIGYGVATGGTAISPDPTINGIVYRVLQFTGDGTLTVTKAGLFDALVIGGGGAGGDTRHNAGGGGAGGGVTSTTVYLDANATILVGAGGSRSASPNAGVGSSLNGQAFLFSPGGGGGGSYYRNTGQGANNGGNGTGAASPLARLWTTAGFTGGTALGGSGTNGAGGGAGSGGNGNNAASSTVAGAGGAGFDASAFRGEVATTTLYGGGGGGGATTTRGTGGSGGGGNGSQADTNNGSAGGTNQAAGGGGGNFSFNDPYDSNGFNGGSGIVLVRFKV